MMKIPRLFVPLNSEPYTWFSTGKKNIELRRYGRQYTEKHVYLGRIVELRKGYGKSAPPLWGVIKRVAIYQSLEDTIKRENFHNIIPVASDSEDAFSKMSQILNINDNYSPLIAFEIKILKEPQFIEFQPHFIEMLKTGKKTSTIRLDWRPYKIGSCIVYSTKDSIIASISKISYLKLSDLQISDAHIDGFDTIEQLHETLQSIYPQINQDSKITLVEFGGNNEK